MVAGSARLNFHVDCKKNSNMLHTVLTIFGGQSYLIHLLVNGISTTAIKQKGCLTQVGQDFVFFHNQCRFRDCLFDFVVVVSCKRSAAGWLH